MSVEVALESVKDAVAPVDNPSEVWTVDPAAEGVSDGVVIGTGTGTTVSFELVVEETLDKESKEVSTEGPVVVSGYTVTELLVDEGAVVEAGRSVAVEFSVAVVARLPVAAVVKLPAVVNDA